MSGIMREPKRLLRRLLPHIPALLPAVVFLILFFALAHIDDRILERVPNYVWLGGGALVLMFAAEWTFLRPRWEERLLGHVSKQPFKLEPAETLVFSSYYSGGALLYLRAGDYSPKARIRRVVSEKNRLLGDRYLRVWVTDRRLMLESQSGNTWRIIPVPSIEWVRDAPRRFFFSPDRLVIGYHHEGHSEVLVIEDKSVIGRTLKEAFLGLNLLSA